MTNWCFLVIISRYWYRTAFFICFIIQTTVGPCDHLYIINILIDLRMVSCMLCLIVIDLLRLVHESGFEYLTKINCRFIGCILVWSLKYFVTTLHWIVNILICLNLVEIALMFIKFCLWIYLFQFKFKLLVHQLPWIQLRSLMIFLNVYYWLFWFNEVFMNLILVLNKFFRVKTFNLTMELFWSATLVHDEIVCPYLS